ncbi:HEPN domain-containing protein, partial [Pseudomonas sp. p99-361]|uniref:HEPN domain-containing protein n=1 Tax=Pseudomonas sp. p99-361 TaxID=2479852 RepID=UPI0013155A00
ADDSWHLLFGPHYEAWRCLRNQGRFRVLVHQADILRSAVVFMHAMLEDCLRTIAAHYLPLAGEDFLNKIPLQGLNSSGKPEKFHLGELHKLKGMTVDQLIAGSVSSYLDRTTFNNVSDIVSLLKFMNKDASQFSEFFPSLEKMINRRHEIVHRGDRTERPGKGKQYANSIRLSDVEKWAAQSNLFLERVFVSLADEGTVMKVRFVDL